MPAEVALDRRPQEAARSSLRCSLKIEALLSGSAKAAARRQEKNAVGRGGGAFFERW